MLSRNKSDIGICKNEGSPSSRVACVRSVYVIKDQALMYISCLHIDGLVRLYPYLAMCEVSYSCEFNS